MTEDLYQEIILEEYAHPHNRGEIADADVTLTEVNASCGDEVTVFIKFSTDKKKITDVKWYGVGCSISIATTSVLSQMIIGQTVKAVMKLQKKDLEDALGIKHISPGREKCLMLGLKAFQKAIMQQFPELTLAKEKQ
jgi:nitrogen fixation protein NifU and related proteins